MWLRTLSLLLILFAEAGAVCAAPVLVGCDAGSIACEEVSQQEGFWGIDGADLDLFLGAAQSLDAMARPESPTVGTLSRRVSPSSLPWSCPPGRAPPQQA